MNQYIQQIGSFDKWWARAELQVAALSALAAHDDATAIQDKMSQVVDLLERIAESQRVQTAILESIAEDKGIKKTWQADGATHYTLNRSLNEVSFADNE